MFSVTLCLFHWFPTNFFPAPFSSQRLLDALLLARFQVEGVFLDFLDDVFLLDLSLETAQSIFDRFTILNSNFRQSIHPQSGCDRLVIITYFDGHGDLSLMLGACRKTLLSCERREDLRRMLRHKEGDRNRLPFVLSIPEGKPVI